jgi:hypothetical protein
VHCNFIDTLTLAQILLNFNQFEIFGNYAEIPINIGFFSAVLPMEFCAGRSVRTPQSFRGSKKPPAPVSRRLF